MVIFRKDKDWYVLSNQLMGCVKFIRIKKKDKETHICGGQFLFSFLFILGGGRRSIILCITTIIIIIKVTW